MTPAQLRAALIALRWSARGVAAEAGYSPTLGAQWLSGRSRIPVHVAEYIRRCATAVASVGSMPKASKNETGE